MFTFAAGVAVALVLSACGGSSKGTSTIGGQPSAPAPGAPNLSLHSTSLGSVLADSSGRTLYLLTSDRNGSLACTGGCLQVWAPLMLSAGATPQAGSGVTGTLGVVARGSNKQVTIAGHPLYTYTADDGPGQTNGQGIQSYNGTWYVVNSSGASVTSSAGGGASPSPTSGYSY
jgi:predicted lipoprotein with Yx(FWY)xxD motif